MFASHRRNVLLLLVLALILLFTDSALENSARLWFVGIFGLEVGGTVSISDYLNIFQASAIHQIFRLANYVNLNTVEASGIAYIVWQIVGLVVSVLKTVVSNFYLFYAAVLTLIYFVMTSRLFRNSYEY